jgi:hypothetical protein
MPAKPRLPIALMLPALITASARAERPPEPKHQADLIVTGQVGKVYTNTDSADVNYIVEIEGPIDREGPGGPARSGPRRPLLPAPTRRPPRPSLLRASPGPWGG